MGKLKLLFVCASMSVGGAEKSLVNLLNLIDYTLYDVDLLLFQRQGAFLEQVPSKVCLLKMQSNAFVLYDKTSASLKALPLKAVKYVSTLYERLRWKDYDVLRAHRWIDVYRHLCEPIDREYDVAIAFQSGEPEYYVIDKVKAKRKVVYFHTDISNIKLDLEIEQKYLKKADLIVTISDKCVKSLNAVFPEFESKTTCLQNITSPELIRELAGKIRPVEYASLSPDEVIIVSIGRLIYLKGYDMAIDAAEKLKNMGRNFHWFIVGEGNERSNLEKQIKQLGLTECVHLLGIRTNPYPYMKFADIVVQSSRYEGKSMVLDEAKILNKPIIVTNYNSVSDQINNEFEGIIVEMSAEGIAKGIEQGIRMKDDTHNHLLMAKDKYSDIQAYMSYLIGDY